MEHIKIWGQSEFQRPGVMTAACSVQLQEKVGHTGGRTQAYLKVLEAVLLGCKRPCEAECEGQDSGTQVLGLQHMEEQLHQAGVFLQ